MDIQKYITNSKKEIEGPHKEWIDDLLLRLYKSGIIFEIGSATSRDANYMEETNPQVKVIRSDKEIEFVKYIKNLGKEAEVFDILNDKFNYGITYKAFYAHMVINHFSLDELKNALPKIKAATEKDGYISVSFPLGDNSTLIDWNNTAGNIFCRYHSIQEVVTIANDLGINCVYLNETQDKKMCYITFQV